MRSLGKKPEGARLERMRASPRFAGDRFRNVQPIPPGLRDPNATMPSLSDFLCGGERRVPRGPLPSMNPLDSWHKPPSSGLRATWLGHSTVLLEIDGARILTDPVWGPRASPTRFAGPKRFQPVPVSMSDLPKLDAVLVSHDHYDHLDFTTMRLLRRVNVPIITSLGVGAHLESFGIAPERIIVIGDLTRSWQRFGPTLEAEVRSQTLPGGVPPQVIPVHEDGMARLRGTVALVLRKHFG